MKTRCKKELLHFRFCSFFPSEEVVSSLRPPNKDVTAAKEQEAHVRCIASGFRAIRTLGRLDNDRLRYMRYMAKHRLTEGLKDLCAALSHGIAFLSFCGPQYFCIVAMGNGAKRQMI